MKFEAEVQEEFRHGGILKDNFAFLHGKDTSVLGSSVAGQASCGREECQQLAVVSANNYNYRSSSACTMTQ